MEIWADIYNNAGAKIGDGPIYSIMAFNTTANLSAAGQWQATVPALDTRAMALLQPKRVALFYTWGPTGAAWFIGGGPIEDLRVRIDADVPLLDFAGGDLLTELAQATMPYTEAADGEAAARAAMPGGWTMVETDTLPAWSARYAHESVLAAWVRAAKQLDFSFRLAPAGGTIRRLELFTDVVASGIRATIHASAPAIDRNTGICLIRTLTEQYSSYDIANRAYVFGAGDWRARLTLAYATLWPDGAAVSGGYTDPDGNTWTLTAGESRIDCTSSQATYGTLPMSVDAKDISPLTNSTADLQAAANALLATALASMRYRVAPQYAYDLEVGALRAQLLPGQSIHVEARVFVDGARPIDIDRELTILAINSKWDSDGARIDKLTVGTGGLLISDAGTLANTIQAQAIVATYPQLSASVDTIPYSEPLDDDATGNLRFWLGEETAAINQILLRFRVDPLRSTAKAIGGTLTGSFTLGGHTHDVTIDAHTHSVTISAHDHDIPDHQHGLTIIGNGTGALTYDIGFGAGGTAGGVRHNIDATDWEWVTDADSGATTSEEGGGATPTTASGGGQTKTSTTGLSGTFTVDLTNALALEYGIFEADPTDTYGYDAIQFVVNGVAVAETPTALGSDWYSLNLTSYVVDAGGLRPAAAANLIAIAIKTASKTGKTCQVTAQLERRTTIQAISY